MADNITLNAGSGGQVIRALDDNTQIWPVGITAFATTVGSPDVCSIVTPTTGLPVRLADGSGYIATLPVSLASVPSHAVTGPLTDAELRASAVPVSLASVPSHAVTNAGTFAVQAAQSGTWTVELGATDNAVLDAIAASLAGTLTVGSHAVTNAGTFAVQAAQSGTWNIANVSGTISLPTGAATAAKQPALGTAGTASSDVLTVQGIASMTPLLVNGSGVTQPVSAASLPLPSGAATAANQATEITHLSTIAGAVSGTEVQVDVLTMPTVTVSDGGGAITVDGTVTANAGTGTFAVSAASLPLPSGAATLAEQQSQTTALQLIDDAVATVASAITTKGIAAVGTDGTNARILKTDASGELQVDVLSMPTTTVTGTVAATQSGTWTVTGTGGTFPVTDSGGSLTVDAPVGTPVFVRLSDGASAISTLPVSLASVPSHAVTNAGTFAVQAAQSGTWTVGLSASQTLTTVTTVSTLTGGGIAHDSADSGNPHKIGAKAKSTLGGITLVSANDRTDLYADVDGVLLVREHAPLADNVSGVASITDGSSTSVIAAQGSGVKTYITDVAIANTSATAVTVDIRDGAAGSVKWTFPVPANTAGVVYSFRRPLAFSANTAVAADPSAAASTITVSLGGFKSKV